MRKISAVLFATLLGLAWTASGQTTITASATNWADATITNSNTTANNGSGTSINCVKSMNNYQYALTKIDVSSLSGTNIQNARLDLYLQWFNNFPNKEWFYFYEVTSAWSESTVTWDTKPTYSTVPFDSVYVDVASSLIKGFWLTAPHFTSMVKKWMTTPASNFGFIITTGKDTYGGYVFASKENSAAATRPQLVVNTNGAMMSGTVTETKAKTPVAGIILTAIDSAKGFVRAVDTTDVNGNFRLDMKLPGTYTIKQRNAGGYHLSDEFTATIPENVQMIHNFTVTKDTRAIAGSVSGTWNSDTVFVVGDLSIDQNNSLTINPATVVLFESDFGLTCSGSITANGEQMKPITWTSKYKTSSMGAGIEVSSATAASFKYNVFEYQKKQNGGAISCEGTNIVIENSTFRYNQALLSGGAIYVSTSTSLVIIKNNLIYENRMLPSNTSGVGGGGIACYAWSDNTTFNIVGNLIHHNIGSNTNSNDIGGGGMKLYGGKHIVVNNTVTNNTAGQGAGIYYTNNYSGVLKNNIVYGNKNSIDNDQITFETSDLTGSPLDAVFISRNIIEKALIAARTNATLQSVDMFDEDNNLAVYPAFADTTNNDFHLLGNSYAIGTGATDTLVTRLAATDLEGKSRLSNGKIDVGCYEFMGVLKNRLPKIDSLKPMRIFSNSSITRTVPFFEADELDVNTITAVSDKPEVVITHLPNAPASEFVISSANGWTGTATITVTVKDSSNKVVANVNQRSFVLTVSDEMCGSVAQDLTWQGTVDVQCSMVIEAGYTLTIMPGTKILFDNGEKLTIKGRIRALGTAADSIRFTLKDATGFPTTATADWAGIAIDNISQTDTMSFRYCVFEYNKNTVLNANGTKNLIVANCVFRNNPLKSIRALNASCKISKTTFTNCAVALHNEDSKTLVQGCRFVDNSSNYDLVYNYGYKSELIINQSYFARNKRTGAGIINDFIGKLNVYNSLFENNSATTGGGVLSVTNAYCFFTNCTFVKNSSIKSAVVNLYIGKVVFTNSILYGNTATDGSIISLDANGEAEFTNCLNEKGVAGIKYVIFNETAYNAGKNIDVNPMFTDYTNGDYSLDKLSPCVNKGAVLTDTIAAFDFLGKHRQFEPDMGAFEFILPNTKPNSISLSSTNAVGKPTGAPFAKILATDSDPWDSLSFSLTTTLGVNSNRYFSLKGDSLMLISIPKSTTQSTLVVEISASDFANESIAKQFTIVVEEHTSNLPTANNIELRAWPVPATDVLNVSVSNAAANSQIVIENQLGEMLKTQTANLDGDSQIDIGHLPAGYYIVRIGSACTRFVK